MKSRVKGYTRLRRPCERCSEYYTPDGKFQKYCNKCIEKAIKLGKEKQQKTLKAKKGKPMETIITKCKNLQLNKNGFIERRLK